MKRYLEVAGPFALFVVFGGAWVWLLRLLPEGTPRDAVVLGTGTVFVVGYLVLLVRRLRTVLGGTPRIWLQLGMLGLELTVLLFAFAFMHQKVGIVDTTRPGNPVTYDFLTSLYFSVITFTTVGFGEIHPVGAGRAIAALQGITGYLVLGSLASTTASMISPHTKAGLQAEKEREEREERKEQQEK